ncbi:MAG: MerR family DNA-binding transcriptional regulator [Anaerolineae bacterium]|nr:MerR family DNA-binding transcriptional regulator [Anaerolineae bacterium]
MLIHEFSQRTGVSTKTIRFYEAKGLLPRPPRTANNYRQYSTAAMERLQFIAGARILGFSLNDVAEFLRARDDQQLPCQRVMDSLDTRVADLDRRIADLIALRETLVDIKAQAENLPETNSCEEQCVCYLLTVDRENGKVSVQKE